MTKLQEQLKLAEEYGFKEIVIPVEEAREALELRQEKENQQRAREVPAA